MTLRAAVVGLLVLALGACDDSGLAAGDCLSARDCSSGEACVSGRCEPLKPRVECEGDDACDADSFCDLGVCRARASVPGADASTPGADAGAVGEDAATMQSCATDPECGAGAVCEASLCVPGCASAGSPITCGANMVCNAVSGRCDAAPVCASDTECAAPTEVCEGGQCVPGCAEAGAPPCTGGTMCDAGSGRCVMPPPCPNDGACGAPAAICEAGACVPGCSSAGGLMCGMGTVCNSNTGRCQQVAGPCTMDAQCMMPQSVCEGGQCVPGCAEPGGIQCSGATACNAATGRCDPVAPPPCQTDAQCNPPSTICVATACVPGCMTSGCTGTDVCNATTGRCETPPPPPVCAPDAMEDNDNTTTPSLGLMTGQTVPNLTACDLDDDYYAFDLVVGDMLRAEALFTHAEGDLDLQILTPGGTVGASGSSVTDNEDVTYTAAASGRHLVRVFLYRDQGTLPGNTYSVRLTHTPVPPPPMCAPDRFENDDTQATAHPFTLPVSETALTMCDMDDDYFALTLTPGDEITATVTFNTAEGDVDLRLLDPAGTSIASSTGVTSTERVTYAALAAGTYALRVYLYRDTGATPGASYDLSVTTQVVCPQDALEDNDTQAAQRTITAGTYANLSACNLDDDYYRVTLAAGQTITVNLTFMHAEGDIDLYLLDAAGTSQALSLSVTDDESITFTPTTAGNYTIRVRLYGDLGTRPGNFYSMQATY